MGTSWGTGIAMQYLQNARFHRLEFAVIGICTEEYQKGFSSNIFLETVYWGI